MAVSGTLINHFLNEVTKLPSLKASLDTHDDGGQVKFLHMEIFCPLLFNRAELLKSRKVMFFTLCAQVNYLVGTRYYLVRIINLLLQDNYLLDFSDENVITNESCLSS